jgi:hypothetical protein
VDENVSFSSSIEERVVTEWDGQRRFKSPSDFKKIVSASLSVGVLLHSGALGLGLFRITIELWCYAVKKKISVYGPLNPLC